MECSANIEWEYKKQLERTEVCFLFIFRLTHSAFLNFFRFLRETSSVGKCYKVSAADFGYELPLLAPLTTAVLIF